MKQPGWFAVSRSDFNSPALRDSRERGLFAAMVGQATWRDDIVYTRQGAIQLTRGELLISERTWSADWGYPRSTFRDILVRMAGAGLIEIDRRRVARGGEAGSIIKVLGYDCFARTS